MSTDPRDRLDERTRRKLLEAAIDMADAMRARIEHVMAEGFQVQAKADTSLVTTADIEAEKTFRAWVEARFPEHGVIGEEFGRSRDDAEFVWVVDPVDGTAEFARDVPFWGSIIGLFHQGLPLLGVIDHPALGVRCHATHGLGAYLGHRRLQLGDLSAAELEGRVRTGTPSKVNYAKRAGHGALFDALCDRHPNIRVLHTCYTHTQAACGGLDAAIEWNAPIWDVGASQILVEEAGGCFESMRVYRDAGDEPLHCVVFGKPALVASIVEAFEQRLAADGLE
ncbi:MAG: inositol monophosphatase [Gammaproteobacteria bacterium]|nr:inositol monophosphatase [Gammaproteobacteria bacterium]